MARLFTAMAVGGRKLGFETFRNSLGSMMSRLFVPRTEQPLLGQGRSSIGSDGLGWLTPGRTGRALGLYVAVEASKTGRILLS